MTTASAEISKDTCTALCARCKIGPYVSHLIQLGLLAGKGEGEAQREFFVLYAHLLHEIGQTISYVVKKLQRRENRRNGFCY